MHRNKWVNQSWWPVLALAITGCLCSFEIVAQDEPYGETFETQLHDIQASVIDDIETFTGDLDLITKRRLLRVATSFSMTGFFLDGGEPRGAVPDSIDLFLKQLNEGRDRRDHIHSIFVPLPRQALLDAVVSGKADIAAANLTITPARLERVAFSDSFDYGVSEVVVTGPASPDLATLNDLSGKTVHVRGSSSYFESLDALSRSFQAQGRDSINIVQVSELLESEDILDLVASGTYKLTVIDSHVGRFWADLRPELQVRPDLAVADDRSIGWAFRKDSPQLQRALQRFVKEHRKGTLLGNMILNRYLRDNTWVRNPLAGSGKKRFELLDDFFQQFGEEYDVEWLLTIAQGYQESRLDQNARSSAGAIGVMQVKPSTAADPNVDIPDIDLVENNIHAGIRYLTFIRGRYFSSDQIAPMDQLLFSLAAYNAGPRRIMDYRRRAAERGLDPDRWLENVEEVSNSETTQYVKNILKYFFSYREHQRLVNSLKAAETAKTRQGK